MVSQDVHILDPFWLSSQDNLQADFLSRQALVAWDFQLSHRMFRQVCQVTPTLDAFAISRMNLLPRYMTWERDESTVGQNCLNFLWDPVTWLFPLVPLLPAVLREVEEQQIEAILICLGWEQALWWPHFSKMLVQPIWRLPASRLCLSYLDYDFLSHHIATNKYHAEIQFSLAAVLYFFCNGLNVQPITCLVAVIVKYIQHRFEEGVSYSTMNMTNSAISKFHCYLPGNIPIGNDQLVQKAMKSFFKQRLPLSKY